VDRIRLEGLAFDGRHGVSDAERAQPQPFTVDMEVEADLHRAGSSDALDDTIDYRALRAIAHDVITGESAHLIESLAERIAGRALTIPGVIAVSVRVAKRPKSMEPLDAVAVEIRRTRA
jgi:dihydroneopterin aldolase/2-amino-4-hydroxy-6-hydroxymethyldihydropteridine diphosphokinase